MAKEVKKPAAKKEVAKPAVKKAAAPKKAEPKKEVAKKVATKEVAAEVKTERKKSGTYHVSKRSTDGMWQVKVSGGKVIKLFKTKAEAEEYTSRMALNQDKAIIFHASKGKNKGKFGKL